ncbi:MULTISPECIES: copper transporter [unclassified Candidatus Frackibacter]|uniref:copper transporter n=1 Tax=unclassified Candidatus Frackibacter TaxID=2648818 RepID=UPI0008877DC7|nr:MULTISPECIES: copper transporter [unclassified Candidatus Frackibacter]SDC02502.1 Copper transport outer membrane protein, MctB [Candidatus Frackibacter sp. WG11]SEM69776.1 Copper transport outer membrane protein, MctB [Candidatus Frackibacter sp. WG12]SFL81012.1 Copper transport outer membrane protein, MctB [Candidatus Frackibacter sp. WG13]
MVIDLRYQIVTIVIIFLTLGIGILIGSSMVGQEGLINQQKELINRLEVEFTRLRQNNRQFQDKINNLQAKLERSNQFQKKVFPLVIKDRINGSKVLITYSKGEFKSQAEELSNILKVAGSQKVFIEPLELLKKEKGLTSYDYLIYLGTKEIFRKEKIKERFRSLFKKVTYLSNSIIGPKPKLMDYILKLSDDLKASGGVQFEE